MPEYTLSIYNDSIELTCDECGHVNHWAEGITLDEINESALVHTLDKHSTEAE